MNLLPNIHSVNVWKILLLNLLIYFIIIPNEYLLAGTKHIVSICL